MRPLTDPATYCLIICALAFGLAALMSIVVLIEQRLAVRRAERMLDRNTAADEHLATQHDPEM